MKDYILLDSGNGRKLERFGSYVIDRPSAQTVWAPHLLREKWDEADAYFTREGENQWILRKKLPEKWILETAGIRFQLSSTDFGHLGIFPEQNVFWEWIRQTLLKSKRAQPLEVLNLFAYSGGVTLAAAQGGAKVCHLDASKGMVAWARENAALNGLEGAPIRWIIDDVFKFLMREKKRGRKYDAIILDPPSFGRGSQGEIFKIEEDILKLLQECNDLLSEDPLFMLFSCHTPGFTPLVLHHLLSQVLKDRKGSIDIGEMTLRGAPNVLPLPSGAFARWTCG